jgi:hypothetical protein
MKKILLPILIFTIILGMSDCAADNDDNTITNPNGATGDKNAPEYFTVTYHKDEGTIGEPPVDSTHYKPPVVNPVTYADEFIDTFIILGQGTMVKKGHRFEGWMIRHPDYTESNPRYYDTGIIYPGTQCYISHNFDLDPVWMSHLDY